MDCCGNKKGSSSKFKTIVILIFAAGGGYYLWMQHRAHVFQYLPLVIFLLCPLMHLFGGHRGHGGHDHSEDKRGDSSK